MKKINVWLLSVLFVGIISCRDTKKEQEELNKDLNTIEAVEKDIDQTVEEVEKKAEEVESALKELDSL
ncbi:hypothetical protein [uncultured Muriicola sp.]|uniref:hypothetical protein n=1 Tax=uncultured Muriicola sp. TaxID=1583102 RepID=UPI00263141DE|nr:hypothetical protein [uncultured Muriicola sp.]